MINKEDDKCGEKKETVEGENPPTSASPTPNQGSRRVITLRGKPS